ncbi:hypothetical protein SAMN05661008_00329 [Alkalithermobacter thermoalcaliphilus JW-YL-7 = DSM 7308]|uniref:Uncharacterized protein n=1 Tax=Alkalithermobacter thermoalcaliphilus JW-YL-7 = DSM 7308 TaxID=1121328 RepID=A0A150FQJ9_CLOPD|nr:hypothetical protein JWYL7_0560 [[Clostridium] paradoxum JW-YL-7 = DSM 7308]SHK49954.1 hypothetical protein SAMN05661008_00329 [[Clostridium] paradoxum JW-YL-7 = DSM 7308]
MSEVTGVQVEIRIGGTPIEFIDEEVTTEDNRIYTIKDTNKNIFDYNTPIIVNGVNEPFLIDYPNGRIIFKEAKEREITIDGKYVTTSVCAYANSYSLDVNVDLYDVSRFGDTHRRRITGAKTASGTIGTWDIIDDYFTDKLISGDPVFIDIKKSNKSTRLWAILNSEELSSAIDSPQNKTVSFQSVGMF